MHAITDRAQPPDPCLHCEGRGHVGVRLHTAAGCEPATMACPACDGSGQRNCILCGLPHPGQVCPEADLLRVTT